MTEVTGQASAELVCNSHERFHARSNTRRELERDPVVVDRTKLGGRRRKDSLALRYNVSRHGDIGTRLRPCPRRPDDKHGEQYENGVQGVNWGTRSRSQ
jgi:hypothetical protein